jgi:hypothetical protein
MNIYIMSRGRAGKVNTLNWISEKWRDRTYIVMREMEDYAHYYRGKVGLITAPQWVDNYSKKFQWILDGLQGVCESGHNESKAIIIDDDLVFSTRVGNSLRTVRDPNILDEMWDQIEQYLEDFALVGVHPRQMGQEAPEPMVLNGRIICLQGVNRELIGSVKVDQFPILADVVLNCTLLSRGKANAILTTYFQDHGPCQAPGGCSIYRTPAMQREAVEYLALRWPGFVKVVERRPKVAKWMGDVRYDYRCQWKQLFAAGSAHVLDPGKVPNPDKEGGRITEAVVGQ